MLFIVIPDVLFLISSYFRYQPGNLLPYSRDLVGRRSGQKISGRVLTRVKEIEKSPSSRYSLWVFGGRMDEGGFIACHGWPLSVSVMCAKPRFYKYVKIHKTEEIMSTLAYNWISHWDLMYCCCMNAQINTSDGT